MEKQNNLMGYLANLSILAAVALVVSPALEVLAASAKKNVPKQQHKQEKVVPRQNNISLQKWCEKQKTDGPVRFCVWDVEKKMFGVQKLPDTEAAKRWKILIQDRWGHPVYFMTEPKTAPVIRPRAK